MSTLHSWNKPNSTHSQFRLCLASMRADDALLLIEDAVYLTLEPTLPQILADNALNQNTLYALADDLAARGISARIPPAIKVIGYKDWVALCLAHKRLVNWI